MSNLDPEILKLFKQVRVKLGAPVRRVQLDDDALCTLLETCLEDYYKITQNFLVESQWSSLYGKNLKESDMAFALSTRTMDSVNDWSYWFSKEVGLQQRGPWELKRDFITIEEGKQSYIIPAGREIYKVMWFTPQTTTVGAANMIGGVDMGGGAGMFPGFAQFGNMGGGSAYGGGYMIGAYDSMLMSTDLKLKQNFLKSDLVYTVTAGPEGTRILNLISTPGSKLSFGSYRITDSGNNMWSAVGRQIWYNYYDISDPEKANQCRVQNPEIILTPDQVPMDDVRSFSILNTSAKVTVRELLVAESKITLGNIRGYASGKVSIPDAEMILDYAIFLEQGKAERDRTIQELTERLGRLMPQAQMETQAKIAQSMNDIKKFQPVRGWMMI